MVPKVAWCLRWPGAQCSVYSRYVEIDHNYIRYLLVLPSRFAKIGLNSLIFLHWAIDGKWVCLEQNSSLCSV